MINYDNIRVGLSNFKGGEPFDHCVIDNFFEESIANQLAGDFPDYDSPDWYFYNNSIEHKKALNNWEKFPKSTYQAFGALQSSKITDLLAEVLGERIFVDHGLNGGGWHIHGKGGNLNPHLDYSIHPKLGLERVFNIIIYLSADLRPEHGGHLGLWTHDAEVNAPGELVKEVEPRFNRAVIFNTTQNSWHGMSRNLDVPEGVYRKSLAIYYLREPAQGADTRGRALFAPREEQKGDAAVLETIKLRSSVGTSSKVYRS
jgi:Rps23 Pro-64 3,4-dihydroxylase Tpa1-like proline 4-hydroxylase